MGSDVFGGPTVLEAAAIAWRGENATSKAITAAANSEKDKRCLALYVASWSNPYPEKLVKSVVMMTTVDDKGQPVFQAAPFCVAITADRERAAIDYAKWYRAAEMLPEYYAEKYAVPAEVTNSIGMKFALIPAGESFLMGSPPDEPYRDENERQRMVNIVDPHYYLAACEVTQEQYRRVMGENPSQFSPEGRYRDRESVADTRDFPVDSVTWGDARAFCERQTEVADEKTLGRTYRLPSEAEWEYACRAGSRTRFSFGDDAAALVEYAWFAANADRPHPVGQKRPNGWGLHDMHGNVWE
jgi:formylglycine-generating enzyme required for sulfatase activity